MEQREETFTRIRNIDIKNLLERWNNSTYIPNEALTIKIGVEEHVWKLAEVVRHICVEYLGDCSDISSLNKQQQVLQLLESKYFKSINKKTIHAIFNSKDGDLDFSITESLVVIKADKVLRFAWEKRWCKISQNFIQQLALRVQHLPFFKGKNHMQCSQLLARFIEVNRSLTLELSLNSIWSTEYNKHILSIYKHSTKKAKGETDEAHFCRQYESFAILSKYCTDQEFLKSIRSELIEVSYKILPPHNNAAQPIRNEIANIHIAGYGFNTHNKALVFIAILRYNKALKIPKYLSKASKHGALGALEIVSTTTEVPSKIFRKAVLDGDIALIQFYIKWGAGISKKEIKAAIAFPKPGVIELLFAYADPSIQRYALAQAYTCKNTMVVQILNTLGAKAAIPSLPKTISYKVKLPPRCTIKQALREPYIYLLSTYNSKYLHDKPLSQEVRSIFNAQDYIRTMVCADYILRRAIMWDIDMNNLLAIYTHYARPLPESLAVRNKIAFRFAKSIKELVDFSTFIKDNVFISSVRLHIATSILAIHNPYNLKHRLENAIRHTDALSAIISSICNNTSLFHKNGSTALKSAMRFGKYTTFQVFSEIYPPTPKVFLYAVRCNRHAFVRYMLTKYSPSQDLLNEAIELAAARNMHTMLQMLHTAHSIPIHKKKKLIIVSEDTNLQIMIHALWRDDLKLHTSSKSYLTMNNAVLKEICYKVYSLKQHLSRNKYQQLCGAIIPLIYTTLNCNIFDIDITSFQMKDLKNIELYYMLQDCQSPQRTALSDFATHALSTLLHTIERNQIVLEASLINQVNTLCCLANTLPDNIITILKRNPKLCMGIIELFPEYEDTLRTTKMPRTFNIKPYFTKSTEIIYNKPTPNL